MFALLKVKILMLASGFKYKIYFRALLLLLSVHFCIAGISQSASNYNKKRFTFHIEKPDTSISLETFAVNPEIHTNDLASYSWYADGKVIETKGGYSGRLLHGTYVSYYGNKSLRERGNYVKGRKEGKWMKWHSNGKINEISYWRLGVKHGKYVLIDDMGRRMLSANFKKDKLNGTMISYEKGAELMKTKYRNGVEVPVKIPKEKSKSTSTPKNEKPSFIKSIFKKSEKGKEGKPVKEKKKGTSSLSSNQ